MVSVNCIQHISESCQFQIPIGQVCGGEKSSKECLNLLSMTTGFQPTFGCGMPEQPHIFLQQWTDMVIQTIPTLAAAITKQIKKLHLQRSACIDKHLYINYMDVNWNTAGRAQIKTCMCSIQFT